MLCCSTLCDVLQLIKRSKPCLDIHMEDKTVHSLAADSEPEIDAWLSVLEKVVQSNEQGSVDRLRGNAPVPYPHS